MHDAKKIRRQIEEAARVNNIDLGNTFAHGAKHADAGDVLLAAVRCGLSLNELVDASLGFTEQVIKTDAVVPA